MSLAGGSASLRGLRLFYRTRWSRSALAGLAVAAVVGARWAMWAPALVVDHGQRARFVPMFELAPVVCGLLLVVAFAPRFRPWESMRPDRLRVAAASAALLVLALPQVVALVVAAALPPDAAPAPDAGWYWAWAMSNAAVATALALLLVPVLGGVAAAGSVAVAYVGVVTLQQAFPGSQPWLPLVSGADPHPPWLLTATLALAAVATWAGTGGGSVGPRTRRHPWA